MSRYRLAPTIAQEAIMRGHCGHARFTWNLAVEQQLHWRPGRMSRGHLLQNAVEVLDAWFVPAEYEVFAVHGVQATLDGEAGRVVLVHDDVVEPVTRVLGRLALVVVL